MQMWDYNIINQPAPKCIEQPCIEQTNERTKHLVMKCLLKNRDAVW